MTRRQHMLSFLCIYFWTNLWISFRKSLIHLEVWNIVYGAYESDRWHEWSKLTMVAGLMEPKLRMYNSQCTVVALSVTEEY
jgi:hypothetical protein